MDRFTSPAQTQPWKSRRPDKQLPEGRKQQTLEPEAKSYASTCDVNKQFLTVAEPHPATDQDPQGQAGPQCTRTCLAAIMYATKQLPTQAALIAKAKQGDHHHNGCCSGTQEGAPFIKPPFPKPQGPKILPSVRPRATDAHLWH